MLQLQGKSDARFLETAFKVFRDVFDLKPVLSAAQFLEQVRHYTRSPKPTIVEMSLRHHAQQELSILQGFGQRNLTVSDMKGQASLGSV